MKRLLTIILAIALSIGLTPTIGFAETDQGTTPPAAAFQKPESTDTYNKSFSKNTKVDEFAEGEAIIMLEDQSGKISAFSKKNVDKMLPADITVTREIKFKDGGEPAASTNQTRSAKSVESTSNDFVIMAVESDQYNTEELIRELEKVDAVKYAEPNYKVNLTAGAPDDTYYKHQWSLKDSPGIEIENVWDNYTKGSKNCVVAVLDTGVDVSHEDIRNCLWQNDNLSELAGKNGYNCADMNTDLSDDIGHGTHVAGIIGAQGNNGKGITGVNQNITIMPVKVADQWGDLESEYILQGLGYISDAQSLGVNVVAANMSFGYYSSTESKILKEAIDKIGKKGCVSVCSAGNESTNIDTDPMYPAATDSPYVLSVGAYSKDNKLSSYTNTGKENVDLYAPGDEILSSVPYDIYNPSIYDNTDLSQYYEKLGKSSVKDTVKVADSDGLKLYKTNKSTVSSGSNDSLKWNIKNAKAGDVFNLYVTYGSIKSNTALHGASLVNITDCPHFEDWFAYGSVLVMTETELDSDGELPSTYITGNITGEVPYIGADDPMGYKALLSGQIRDKFTDDDPTENRAVVLTYIVNAPGNHEIVIDDLGISEVDVQKDAFGKYDFYTGTSMASPIVAGVAGLLKSQNSNLTAKQVADKIKKLVKTVDGNKHLDLSNFGATEPYFDSMKVNSDKSITIKGANFGSTKGSSTVSVQGSNLSTVKWSDKEIVIDKAHYSSMVNKVVTIKVTVGGKDAQETFYMVDGKKSFSAHGDLSGYDGGNFTTDGKTLYYYDCYGDVYQEILVPDYGDNFDDDDEDFDESKVKMVKKWTPIGELDPSKVFPQVSAEDQKKGMVLLESDLTYLNKKFYALVELTTGTKSYYSLAAFDLKTEKWSKIADRPGAETKGTKDAAFKNVRLSSLAAYNGKLYMMGGIDMRDYTVKKDVRIFDPATKKWSKGAPLPEGRMLAVGHQSGNKLVLALGGDGKEKDDAKSIPATLIFNGKTWAKGAAVNEPYYSSTYYLPTDKNDPKAVNLGDEEFYEYVRPFHYYTGAVGIVQNGIIISGIAANGLGDTYIYDIPSNSYKKTDYQFNNKLTGEDTIGTVVDNTLYSALVPAVDDFDDYDDEFDYFFGDWDDFDFGDTISISKMPVKSGLFSVYGTVKRGKVIGKGKYLPGQKVSLKASPNKKYYALKLVVDGKTYKSKKQTISASVPFITKNIKVSAKFKKYVTKVKLNKKSINAKAGKTIKLKAKVKKPAKKIKGVTWKSSNKKYATVTKSGKVKIKKAGKGKTVTITATAKDGSKAKAKCKIKIAK